MDRRPLGRTGLSISALGFGAFKIGRNQGIKYAKSYALPSDSEAETLLNGVLDLGINYIDTAPAYGTSEERIGKAIGHRNREFVISTKVGEQFLDGRSVFDFKAQGVEQSVHRSLSRLRRDVLDIAFVHSSGDDEHVLHQTDVVPTLLKLRSRGTIRAIGFSGKTVEGAIQALQWADALMVEYHMDDQSHGEVIAKASAQGIGVVVKKGLASGRLPADAAISFVLSNSSVTSLLVGGLNLMHVEDNARAADSAMTDRDSKR